MLAGSSATLRASILPSVAAVVLCLLSPAGCRRPAEPAALTDREFWGLVENLSEPPGRFAISPNLVSNEPLFAESVRLLRPSGNAYIGVGPEQNFSFIARLRPMIAFIVDIRRENRNLHLLYKALFELSADRADFVSRLFSRPRPAGLAASAAVDDIFNSYEHVQASRQLFATTRALVRDRLVTARGFSLTDADLQQVDRALDAFFEDGPAIHFWGSRSDDGAGPSYRQLMTARDIRGQSRSYLSDEDAFGFVKALQRMNLIVPLVGDFAGSKAIRAVGDYLRHRHHSMQAFYGSNVGVYLTNEQVRIFCGNLSTLPAAPRAVFIESNGVKSFSHKLTACR